MLCECILPVPVQGTFTYNIPAHLAPAVRVGCRVNVPFGKSKQYAALVVSLGSNLSLTGTGIKDIIAVLDDHPVLLPQQLKLWQWVAEYYLCTLGEVYKAAIPSGMKDKDGVSAYVPKTVEMVRLTAEYRDLMRLNGAVEELKSAPKQQLLLKTYINLTKVGELEITRAELQKGAGCSASIMKAISDRGILEIYSQVVSRLGNPGTDAGTGEVKLPVLSQAQQKAYDEINLSWQKHNVTLLHGVTGSGKTEIYIHLIKDALSRGKQVLYLLPEIVLTSQLTDRLRNVFGDKLGVYHSKYTDAERVEVYQKQVSDSPYDIIVGVRSSVLLPFQRLGLVIIDEEHETSFKQQDPAPRYHGRNVAIMMAAQQGAKTLLGTATPSIESYYNATQGKYGLVNLTTRYANVLLPEIEVVDIKELRRKKMMRGPLSPVLQLEVRKALEAGQQIILFQNRRGFAPMVECHVCGWVPQCPNCDVSLTFHKRLQNLTCHYCGYSTPLPTQCPQCGAEELHNRGYGTERIEDVLNEAFPQARVARMDLDTTRSRQNYESIIKDFQDGKTDILVGTQMVTKGLDFRNVTVVGILNASTMLNQPDFRSYERAYQMMTQVAGRAGRKTSGRVILQTMEADNSVVTQVVRNDYLSLFYEQLEERKMFRYPPFVRIVYVYMKHKDERVLEHLADEMARMLRTIFGDRVLGPDIPAVARVQLMYIRKVCIKVELAGNMAEVRNRLRQVHEYLTKQPAFRQAQIFYDVD